MDLESRVAANEETVFANVGEETVILHTSSGRYYGLNDVGAFIWEKIQEPTSIGELRDAVTAAFDVRPEECEQDLYELVEGLQQAGLVYVEGESEKEEAA